MSHGFPPPAAPPPLEACAVGKPVLIGPHTFNFQQASAVAIEAGAAIRVHEVEDLRRALRRLLDDPGLRASMGEAGLALMHAHQGATQRTLALVQRTLLSAKE